MDKKQTAVEWLIDMHFGGIEHVTPYFKKHIEEAKEMEKEQIVEANNNGCGSMMCMIDSKRDGEQYYKETYGGNK
jgi:hypothetical protein